MKTNVLRKAAILVYVLFAGLSVYSQSSINTNNTPPPACQLSHVMGGDISVLHDTGSLYILRVMVFRDTAQYILPANNQIYVYTYNATVNKYFFDSAILVSKDSILSASVSNMFAYGTEVGYYTMPVVLPPGKYQFVYVSCCRNPEITNSLNAAQENQVFHTEIEVFNGSNNSSPCANLTPVAYFSLNKNAAFNPLPYDADADSIVCNLVSPLGTFTSSNATSGFANVAGFTAPPAQAANPFIMNPVSGEITWTPGSLGNFIQSFRISEYRSGVQIGSVIRDMEFLVVSGNGEDSFSFSPLSTYLSNPSPNYNYVIYTPGQALSFQINGANIDSNVNVKLNAYSEIFSMANPATFTTTGSANNVSGTLTWTPPVGFSKNIIVVFRLKGNMFSKDYTLMLLNSPPPPPSSVINIPEAADIINVFPVPAVNTLNIRTALDKKFDLVIVNTLGRKIWNGQLNKELNIDLKGWSRGLYYLQLTNTANGQHIMKKIVVE